MKVSCSLLAFIAVSFIVVQSETKNLFAAENQTIQIVGADSGLKAGWQQIIEIPAMTSRSGEVFLRNATLTLSVEQGWLSVRRNDSQGDVEWQIVLAQPIDGVLPVVRIESPASGLDLRYGPYFVRESIGMLRVLRQKKDADSPTWPQLILDSPAPKESGFASGFSAGTLIQTKGWNHNKWRWAVSGLENDKHDVWVRLEHLDIRSKNANGISSGFEGGPRPPRAFYGERSLTDEGDLLCATRSLREMTEKTLAHQKLVDDFSKQPAPAIDASEWYNAPTTATLDTFKGKVVLIDFWATWCTPCVVSMPKIQALHEKYKDRGLVVIGVHSKEGGEDAKAYLEKNSISFPIAIDTGKTSESYGIQAVPAYFLIDKSGSSPWGFSSHPPTSEEIEKLLK